jgi:hypothetical protein
VDLETALDELYAVGIEAFTAKRNELAKQLSGADAGAVRALKKPNLAAWAVNQLARRHPDEVAEVFAVTDKVRHAQRRVLSGGKATDLRKATDERNKVVGRLTSLAEKLLVAAGHGASASTLQAVTDSLMAVASDDEGAERLRKGRLERELEPSAFIDVSGLTLVESPSDEEEAGTHAEPDLSRLHEARRLVSESRGAVKDATAAYKQADREAERLTRAAEEAERRAKAAHEEAEFARRAADARKAEAEEAEQRLVASQAALSDLERGRS